MEFIFDTGAEYTILTQKAYADILGVSYTKQYKILGSDMKTELIAYLARGVTFRYKTLVAEKQDIFVLEKDYFQFDQYIGQDIQGIIGASFFRHLVVEIDYRKQLLYFYSPQGLPPKKKEGYTAIPIKIVKGKPYLNANLKITSDRQLPIKLLLDTGASLGLLLHTDSTGILHPPENTIPGQVGSGLGGELMGYLGRVHQLQIDDFQFDGILASFQEINTDLDTTFLNGRNGILGNLLLSRFTIILDYIRGELYVKPRRNYNKGFKFDRSGLNIVATGKSLHIYILQSVVPNSPADLAGLQKGDEILSINRVNSALYSLNQINRILQKKEGKKVRMKIKRKGEKKVIHFKLKDLI